MQRLLEILFGAEHQDIPEGATSTFVWTHPTWMGNYAAAINLGLALAALALVIWVYSRDGRRMGVRVGLGILRSLLFAYLLVLINRPVLEIMQIHTTPSVVAILIDDSLSMKFRDTGEAAKLASAPLTEDLAVGPGSRPTTGPAGTRPADPEFLGGTGPRRLDVALGLLTGDDQKLIKELASKHVLHFYRFSRDATALGTVSAPDPKGVDPSKVTLDPALIKQVRGIKAEGESTQIVASLETVLNNLQNEQLDGIVIITDARETAKVDESRLARVKESKVKYFPVLVGSATPKQNLAITSLSISDALKNDIVTARVKVRATGYPLGKEVTVRLKNARTNQPLRNLAGEIAKGVAVSDRPAPPGTQPSDVAAPASQDLIANVEFHATEAGTIDVQAEVDKEPGEYNINDNIAKRPIEVSPEKVNVLYVEGYPRWEYRYLKNEILQQKRETKTVNLACLLTSADPSFRQEADPPEPDFDKRDESGNPVIRDPRTGTKFPGSIARFPENMEELRKFDVILFGDVDPRQFSTKQIKMISDFVGNEGGGFGMIAGPQHSPVKYRNTLIDTMLPVTIDKVLQDDPTSVYRDGWLPVISEAARTGNSDTSLIFRLYADPDVNEEFLKGNWWDKKGDPTKKNIVKGGGMQPLFWYCRGVAAKAPVARVLAHHPYASVESTGSPVPVMVVGKFGAGHTLFNGMEDAWRWRFYNHTAVLDNYWTQQIRYLARGRKMAARQVKLDIDGVQYEAGDPILITLTVYALELQDRKSFQVDLLDANDRVLETITLTAQQPGDKVYRATVYGKYPPGSYRVRLKPLGKDIPEQIGSMELVAPQSEMTVAHVDKVGIQKIGPTRVLEATEARAELPKLITGKPTEVTRQLKSEPLTNTWQALAIFMLLLTAEWVLRKVFGML
jgi:hypothetical protein